MGKEKQTQTTVQNQTVTPTPTAEETRLNQLDLQNREALNPGILANQTAGLDLSTAFLKGQNLPGYFQGLPYGISPEVTQGIVDQSLKDLNTQMAASGAGTYLESGAAQSIGARTAGEIRQNSEQFNLGQLLNLLNLSIGAPAQIQQPINQNAQMFSGRLSGLRSTNMTGNSQTTTLGMNPFLKSFQQSAGTGLGNFFNPQTYISPGR